MLFLEHIDGSGLQIARIVSKQFRLAARLSVCNVQCTPFANAMSRLTDPSTGEIPSAFRRRRGCSRS
jgi:hypothetical protein